MEVKWGKRGKKRLPIQKIDTNPKLSNLKWVTLTGKGLSRKLRGEAGDASERSSTNPQTQPIRKCTAIEGLVVVGKKVEKL